MEEAIAGSTEMDEQGGVLSALPEGRAFRRELGKFAWHGQPTEFAVAPRRPHLLFDMIARGLIYEVQNMINAFQLQVDARLAS